MDPCGRFPGTGVCDWCAKWWLLITVCGLAGCQSQVNPTFPVNVQEAKILLRQMRETPKRLERPVVVLAGYLDPGVTSHHVAKQLRRATGDDRVIPVSFWSCHTVEECRARVLQKVEERFPSDDLGWTRSVDVIGISMGGLIARHAAAKNSGSSLGDRRLRMARLFTIGTPHQGAQMATLPTLNSIQIDMRSGSGFLKRLQRSLATASYELYPYVRLGDTTVGAANAAPPGINPWWIPNRPLEPAHMFAFGDVRILADIARRLRGEPALTIEPAAPLPDDSTPTDRIAPAQESVND